MRILQRNQAKLRSSKLPPNHKRQIKTIKNHFCNKLPRANEEVELVFRINAFGSADAYATIIACEYKNYFWWESSWTHIYVSEEKAEFERLLVLSHPYTTIGKTLCRGNRQGPGKRHNRIETGILGRTPTQESLKSRPRRK